MLYGAIDLHARKSEIRIVDETGAVVAHTRVSTTQAQLVAAFAGWPALRILLEAGTESEWVALALEGAGHTVVVADPNFAPMYGAVQRRVKTDRRDVTALAEANRRGWYRAAHRTSATQRAVKQVLRSRRHVVQARSGTIALIRALVRQEGLRVPTGAADRLATVLAGLALPPTLAATLAPLRVLLETLTAQVAAYDAQLRALTAADPVVTRLQTVPGVGPVVATTYRALLDDVTRFRSAGHVSAAVGLVPREDSSAERRHRGHITKAGPSELRSLLVQAAWACWRSRTSGTLRAWVERLAARRGKRIAVVALARRLSRILYAIWRDGSTFDVTVLARAS